MYIKCRKRSNLDYYAVNICKASVSNGPYELNVKVTLLQVKPITIFVKCHCDTVHKCLENSSS